MLNMALNAMFVSAYFWCSVTVLHASGCFCFFVCLFCVLFFAFISNMCVHRHAYIHHKATSEDNLKESVLSPMWFPGLNSGCHLSDKHFYPLSHFTGSGKSCKMHSYVFLALPNKKMALNDLPILPSLDKNTHFRPYAYLKKKSSKAFFYPYFE